DLDELQARADARLETLKAQGVETARLYGRDENDGVGGDGAFFLLLDEPEVYGLPPDPVVTTRDLPGMWKHVAIAAAGLAGAAGALGPGRGTVPTPPPSPRPDWPARRSPSAWAGGGDRPPPPAASAPSRGRTGHGARGRVHLL